MGKLEVQRAAVRLFGQKGFAATGIRELAKEAGCTSATLYHHAGGGKEELLVRIMKTCLEEMLRAGTEVTKETSDPEEQLGMLVAAHVGLSALNPMTSRVTDLEVRSLSGDHYRDVVTLRDDYESLITRALTRGARTGVFHMKDIAMCRLAILEMCNGVSHWFTPEGRLDIDGIQEQFIEFAYRLAGMPPGQGAYDYGARISPIRLQIEPT